MNREAKEKAIDTGYYKGIDLDAESCVPVSFEKVEDGYVLKSSAGFSKFRFRQVYWLVS